MECGRYFRTEQERDDHRVSVSTNVQLICSQCGELATDMEHHISGHSHEVKCTECGAWCGDLYSHMKDVHSGYPSVITIQTNSCAGDGTSVVTR